MVAAALDDDHRPSRVKRHRLGTSAEADELLLDEADAGMFVDIDKTQSGRFLLITIGDHETSETRILDLDRPDAQPVLVAKREPGRQYSLEHHGDVFVILTNAGGAEDFKIVTTPIDAPDPALIADDAGGVSVDRRLKATLQKLSLSADIVLDLHCDNEGPNYLYMPAELWPHSADLAGALDCGAVLTFEGGTDASFEDDRDHDRNRQHHHEHGDPDEDLGRNGPCPRPGLGR